MMLNNGAIEAYIGLGSNLGNSVATLKNACLNIASHGAIQLLAVSPFYRSKPVGPQDQPDFTNAVIRIATNLSPEALLDVLQDIENQHGRVRTQHWGPRTLDLDILLYDQQCQHSNRLTIPHPELANRAFVLYPLRDVAPTELLIPGLQYSLTALLAQRPPDELEKIEL